MEKKNNIKIIIYENGTCERMIDCCSFVLGCTNVKDNPEVHMAGELGTCVYLAAGVDTSVKQLILEDE